MKPDSKNHETGTHVPQQVKSSSVKTCLPFSVVYPQVALMMFFFQRKSGVNKKFTSVSKNTVNKPTTGFRINVTKKT